MKFKIVLPIILSLFFISAVAQHKVFAYSQIQSRNDVQQWGKVQNVGDQVARFSPAEIDLNIDKKYHLTIVSKTDLPDNGIVYLCNDEKSNRVTVMLFDNSKMFLYSKTKRFQINFDHFQNRGIIADTD
ncbi:MAG: hypothetical protein H7199_02835 [Burkholderiales bacterium]|nr:hypothetical protein [Flavobacterium sp.]